MSQGLAELLSKLALLSSERGDPQAADRVEWAHKLFGTALPAQGIFPPSGPLNARTASRLQGIWEALCWVQGCPADALEEFLDSVGKLHGMPYRAKAEPAAAAATNGAAKSETPADDLRAKGYARSRQEVRETIELMQKQIAKIRKEIDPAMPPIVRESAQNAIRTYETIAGTLLWAVDPSSELAREAERVIQLARGALKVFEMLDRAREEAKANKAGVA